MNKLLIYLALIAVGCYSQQAQNIDLSSLDATQGLTITIDSEAIGVGNVNFAGDVNKDGFNDLLLWTDFSLYLIYGSGSPSEINLSNFTLAQGFIISGASETAFGGAGDVNGDKIDDLMIANGVNNTVCVIFGSQLGFQNIDLNDCHNGTFGIEISGCPENYTGCNTGFGVSGAGDINGDNIQDMLISADLMGLPSSANRTQSGVVFVIYGFEGGVSSNINLTTFNSSQGFSIVGPTNNSYLGERMSKAGDVNGDGMNDIIVGAYYGFPAYVIYGNPMGNYNIDLANFNSSQGFTISVANQSTEIKAVTNAGDVNGDNIDDLLLGLDSNGDTYSSAYVLYGSNMMPFNVNISDIVPAQGFSIVTNQTSDYFAQFVSYLGDFNQDGLDDVLLSAYDANNGTGAAYVVFGTKSYPESINADTLPSTQGLVIVGANPYEMAGYTVSGVGDFNGDNVPDIALGTHSDIASGYVVYSPYKFNPNPKPLSAERIGYKAFIVGIVAIILCML